MRRGESRRRRDERRKGKGIGDKRKEEMRPKRHLGQKRRDEKEGWRDCKRQCLLL